ncbi:flagellin [Oleiphilus sp. HI0009]|uniref:flagellin N-terminal helical domain-containing protein n=1 Tax=unclassified Oleiphilus TaxID=2631174 RepID=UPI0007C2854F|nr:MULTISPECIES: flagellin [unclassified Oleiphilus]KZX74941.1 flagellin [Oleiphilus sp. HI0009]KZY69477.1 flagellin [Oleiphilus sp. HI0066]KZY72002.1 flagellin [Oleiphilus sp. HI0067]MCH2159208.1 flagellin [Oleiphilaceae bacterium]
MPQIINTNIASLNAQRNLDSSQSAQETALQRLSSGLRINSAKDDAAGIAIANRIDAQVRGLSVASRNAGDGVSLAQIAEGSIESISTSLQRLRELSVQSSNASNGDSERVALNQEAQQLISEIERTAGSATFNGVNLLDGSFQGKSFQVGANVGDEVTVSLGSVDTSSLGSAASSGVSSNSSKAAIAANATGAALRELVAGDLVINGVSVGASSGGSDTASALLKSSSAISKAAAINAVSDQTGVVATANANTVEGTSVTSASGTTAGTRVVTINGVQLSLVVAASGANNATATQTELGKVADQINSRQDATGVTAAVVETDDGFRVDLTAEDGRNISLLDGTAGDAAAAGLRAGAATNANVYVGNVTLSSTDGSDITLSSTTGNIDNAGFETGTFSGNTASVVGDNSSDASRAALVSGDLTINGANVGATFASDDTASTGSQSASGIALAAAINRISDTTGVSATANQNTVNSAAVSAGAVAGLTINGATINAGAGSSLSEQVTNVVEAINQASGQTGVRAEVLDGDQLTLVADDGRNIVVGGTVTNTGLTADTYVAGVTLTGGGEINLGSETGDIESSGLNIGSYGATESGTLLKDVDISTADGAKAAIAAVDNAINTVNAERAKLGSIQTRFENVISANAIAIENFSASSSRIKDADFAAETAALSRAQVLQQAGISVLAQANARPQQVLSLLQ